METIEKIFSDTEGNHLLVALDFYDDRYKQQTLFIPKEFSDVDIADINIEKVYVDKPIHFSAFFKMTQWLTECFQSHNNAVFTYICSFDELETRHSDIDPQLYRWRLFDCLFARVNSAMRLNYQDVVVGPPGYQSFGRAFYRERHAPIIHIIAAHLKDKQTR